MTESIKLHLVMLAEESNHTPAELASTAFEARLRWNIGCGEVAGLVGRTPLPPGTARRITRWRLYEYFEDSPDILKN